MTEHRCTQTYHLPGGDDQEAEDVVLVSWQPGKVTDCEWCQARRQPRPVKRSGES